jgi:signal transduction histidine kinase
MFNRLAMWQRLVVLSLAFLIPIAALLYFLVGEQSLAIDFARKELAGVQYFRAARPLLAAMVTEGDTGAPRPGDAAATAFSELRRAAAREIPFTATADLAAIERSWQASASAGGVPGEVIDAWLRHLIAVGNESNLVLDPDVDSYYCMDAVVFKLPKLITALHTRRDDETDEALAVLMREAMSAARNNIEFGYRANPAVERRLGPSFTAFERAVLLDDSTGAIAATFAAYDAALDTLELLIEQRVGELQQRRGLSLTVVAISLFVGFGIVFSIQRYSEARNRELSETLDRLTLAQAQLVESEKMAALGNLVAGIAHEINTPIGIGVTATTSLDDETRHLQALADSGAMKRSDLHDHVTAVRQLSDLVLSNLNRASSLIQSFKQVAVDQSSESRRQFGIKAYIGEVLQSLSPRLKKTRITVIVEAGQEMLLDSYPGALSQIITNLVTNSLTHAYDAGTPGTIRLQAVPMAGGLRLTYSDDGKGIPPQHLDKIFDPFFTTRRGQGGSGLGLHIVYNLVTQRLKGRVRCDSREGAGTTFVIDLPHLDHDG